MYGKHFAEMYKRSMVGAGAMVFAVWGYVIATAYWEKGIGWLVNLNPKALGGILGESPEAVKKAIEYLCQPDPESRSKEEEGRRLVQVDQYAFRVVNYEKYRAIKNAEDRRESNRIAQAKWRQRHPEKVKVHAQTAAERAYMEKSTNHNNGVSANVQD